MFCTKCGAEIPSGHSKCEYCGCEVDNINLTKSMFNTTESNGIGVNSIGVNSIGINGIGAGTGRDLSKNIKFCLDGKYRWIYEYNLFTNPGILLLLLKIFFFICMFQFALAFIIELLEDGFVEALIAASQVFAIAFGVMAGLILIGYLVYALMMGGKYIVAFEMDDEGVTHTMLPKQMNKVKAVAWLNIAAGIVSGNPGQVGRGMLAGSKQSSSSRFANVKSIKTIRWLNTIKINEFLNYNQVYAGKEDFESVRQFIVKRCVNAKIG